MKHFFIIYLLLLLSLCASGQQSITLGNMTDSGTKEYVARDYVKFTHGYSYKATGSNTMRAAIDEHIVIPAEYDPPPSPNRSLNYSYAIGTTAGAADVTPTGAAAYQIPIAIPPGMGGVQPNLSIVYNSQTGNGLLGYGWNLAGISAISRVGKTIYHDGKTDAVLLNNTDNLMMDGQRLMLISASGTNLLNAAEYRTEIETFSEIKIKTVSSKLCFEVKTKEGWVLEYGTTADSYIEATGTTTPLQWLLAKVTDQSGNYMTYTYAKDNTTGEFRLKQIDYTGNSGLSPYNRVELMYETRDDKQFAYIAGKKIEQTVLLKRIKVSSANTIFRDYKLNYHWNGYHSKLTEVEEYGQDGKRYNSTVVDWGDYSGSFAKTGTEYSASLSPSKQGTYPIYADFNGDGKMDFISYPVKSSYSSSDVATLFLASTNSNGIVSFVKQTTIPLDTGFTKLMLADLNGDGLMDVILIFKIPVPLMDLYVYNSCIYNGTSFSAPFMFVSSSSSDAVVGDFNGDGKYELLTKSGCKLYNQYGTEIASGGITNWGFSMLSIRTDRSPIDFNGNGKTDLLIVDILGCSVYELNGASFSLLYSDSDLKSTNPHLIGDFNGDGKTDILVKKSATEYYILFATGSGTSTGFVKKTLPNLNVTGEWFAGDFNRDGKTDIAHVTQDNGYGFPLRVGLFDGETFLFDNYTSSLINSVNMNMTKSYEYLHFADFDGDGFPELSFAMSNSTFIIKSFNSKQNLLAQSIIDGLNRKTAFSYAPMTNVSVCNENGYSPSSPVFKFPFPLYLVNKMTTNAAGISDTSTFYYRNPRTHGEGKGFLGFGKVEATNTKQNRKIVTEYGYNSVYFYTYPTQQKVTNSAGNTDILTVNFSNSLWYIGPCHIFPYVSQQTAIDHLSGLTVTTGYQYNSIDDGSPWKITETQGSLSTVTTNTWAAKGSPFKNRITQSVVIRSGLQGTYTHTTGMAYDSYGRLTSKTDFQGSTKAVTTVYSGYDKFGNPATINTTASNCPAIATTFVYDAKGRITSVTDAVGTSETAYDIFGRVTSVKSVDGLTVSYEYDGFDNLKKETNPTGSVSYAQAWDVSGNQLFKIDRTETGAPSQSVWYNALGQELKSRVKGFGGDVYAKKEYNGKGQLYRSYLPEYSAPSTKYTEYTYDAIGRLYKEKSIVGDFTEYTYTGLTTKVDYPDNTSQTTVLNSSGLVESVTDKGTTGGTITAAVTYAYNSLGKPVTITAVGLATKISYDFRGYQRALKDPNLSDSIRYEYDAYGMLRSQKNAQNQTTTYTYDAAGRMLTEVSPDMNLTFHYVSSGAGKGQLEYIKTGSTELQQIAYNALGLPSQITEKIDVIDYITKYTYDTYGRLQQKESHSGFKLKYVYNADGYLTNLQDATNANANLWQAGTVNAFGQVTQSTLGNGLTRKTAYKTGDLTLQSITLNDGSIVPLKDEVNYNFVPSSGNLQQRNDKTNSRDETFDHDALNRLKSIKLGSATAQSITYHPNGNINTKFDVGTYQYSNNNHAVSGISPLAAGYSPAAYSIAHASFNRPTQITQGTQTLNISYSPGKQRNKSVYTDGSATVTRYYNGTYEKEVNGSTTKEYDYVYGPEGLAAIAVKTGTTRVIYYAHTDHLGSLRVLTNSSKAVVSGYRYDAWGKRTLVTGSNITNRGFTMHEHLDDFGLINCNARLYDPVLGRFLAPDNFVQSPGNSQSYNRFSYCVNQPLVFTDPDGELAWFAIPLICAAIWGVGNTAAHAMRGDIDNFWQGLGYFGQGAVTGFALGCAWQFAPLIPGIGQGIQTGMSIYAGAQVITGGLGMIGGFINDASNGFGGNGAFGRAGKIFLGNFYLDENRWLGGIWGGFSRHTWEIPQQFAGQFQSQWRNSFGKVTDVEFFAGATWAINGNAKGTDINGKALGNFINMDDPYYSTRKNYYRDDKGRFNPTYNPQYMHEYGHTFDSRIFGLSYLLAIGIPSAIFHAKDDRTGWTEIRANQHAKQYFEKYYGVDWNSIAPNLPPFRNRYPIEYYFPTKRK